MGKCIKTSLAVVAAHSAAAHSAERQMRICKMQQGVIDAAAAERYVFDNFFAVLLIVGKKI